MKKCIKGYMENSGVCLFQCYTLLVKIPDLENHHTFSVVAGHASFIDCRQIIFHALMLIKPWVVSTSFKELITNIFF